ncbi:hypothetical protein [Halorubrum cibi]|uniref:Uncharacterized protein n=1 Tax=Halorubrum cibi TaxID=413815 RepID=A0A521CSY8_9EURY|nr:hypothetical protein [Halorubrum cibi]SMO62597.1 hypothetical protein SAMN06264867_10583 [Halorubrum cibi]
MAEQSSREDQTIKTPDSVAETGDSVAAPADAAVDEELKRRLREAYLNDEEDALVVTAVRMAGDEVVVETRPPHGETTHVERFDAPRHGSLEECTEFLGFLEAAGVSPLDLDDLVGARVPAAFDPETGWRVARAADRTGSGDAASDDSDPGNAPTARRAVRSGWSATVEWVREYRDWVIAVLLVGGELLFIALIVVLFA